MLARKPKTAEIAAGRWPGILENLGIDAHFLRNKHGPCPACGGHDRFRFDDKDGRGTWICSHCGAGDGFDLLQHLFGWRFREAAEQVERILGTVPMVSAMPLRPERTEEDKVRVADVCLLHMTVEFWPIPVLYFINNPWSTIPYIRLDWMSLH